MFHLIRHTAALVMLLASTNVALGADAGYGGGTADKLSQVRTLIAGKKWATAIEELKQVNDSQSADWNNLMGYSLRRTSTPDLDSAERFYNQALRIDPNHRGALEYSGELYLIKGDLTMAEQRLSMLDKVCRLGCEEYRLLKSAVQRFKDNGNRHVAAP